MKYALICLAVILMVSVSLCTSNGNVINDLTPEPSPTNFTPQNNETNENGPNNGLEEKTVIIPAGGGEVPRDVCIAKGVEKKVIVLYLTGCSACVISVPRLRELEGEMEAEFEFLDFASGESQERINELKLLPEKIPTVVIGCNAHVGVRTKETYKELIEGIA